MRIWDLGEDQTNLEDDMTTYGPVRICDLL